MNTIRMFAFIAAILITAVIFRVIADGLNDEPSIHVATEASATREQRLLIHCEPRTVAQAAPPSVR